MVIPVGSCWEMAVTAIKYTERLAEAGLVPSVGSVGDSDDNALAETINGLYKAEVINRCGPWRSLESVEYAILTWVDWFNNRRLLEHSSDVCTTIRASTFAMIKNPILMWQYKTVVYSDQAPEYRSFPPKRLSICMSVRTVID